jgi:hypothetical protein
MSGITYAKNRQTPEDTSYAVVKQKKKKTVQAA